MENYLKPLFSEAVETLKQLISTPSISRDEGETAALLESKLKEKNIPAERIGNNVWAKNGKFDSSLPTLLLNSHHDTVSPNTGYTRDPFMPHIVDDRLYGLGANDAGGALVSLLATFIHFYDVDLPFNLIFAASAEEEVSGKNGIELLLQHLPPITMGIVGEPTKMEMAIAEKGLLVLDCFSQGVAGHAARDEGKNALYEAVDDINFIKNHRFERVSEFLGEVHLAVTSIETNNKAHNVIPDECSFIVDVRVNELYSFEEVLEELTQNMKSNILPRSLRLKPSSIPVGHPLVRAGLANGMKLFGSATLSDMALMNFPAAKIGPGDSLRSHTADEFIFLSEIENGIGKYIELIDRLQQTLN